MQDQKFDFILCLDILEHLIDYELVIKLLKNMINDDGSLIISLPNIANIYVRLNILFGRFPYLDRGILDRTHFHFFTLGSIKRLLKKHGFDILKIKVSPIPIIEVLPNYLKNNLGKLLNQILYAISIIFKRLFAYQFIITTKNKTT